MERPAHLSLMGVLSGCSVIMAATKPDQKDMDVLVVGTPRAYVLKEFGEPVQTGTNDGTRVDVFKYKEGERSTQKFGRAVLHGGLDLLTFGLWEPFGTATEIMAIQPDIRIEVTYDERDRVASVGPAGLHWVKAGSTTEDLQRDNYECRRHPERPRHSSWPGQPNRFRRRWATIETLYRDCMRAHGYELNRGLPGH